MKYLACLFTLFFTHSVLATNLCATSCDLIITFPDGGSIEAVEALVITFGTGGELDLGAAGTINANPQPVSTDYIAGGMLSLAKGESITIDNNGAITLGSGGNIDYTDMTINSTGGARLKAVGNPETIYLVNLTIMGGLNLTLDAKNISATGVFTIQSDSVLTLIAETGSGTPSVCNIQDPSNGVILTTGVIDTSGTCNMIANDVSLPVGSVTIGIIDPNATLTTTGTITLTPDTITPAIGSSEITLLPETLTQELLSSLPEGTELPTEDGNTCILTSGECVTTDGVKYAVVDGKLVSTAADGSGQLTIIDFFLLFLVLITFRCAGFTSRESYFLKGLDRAY